MRSVTTFDHPRRSLGDRHRSQASKFLKLAISDSTREKENLDWAEQSARQAILHDYTESANWEMMLEIKLRRSDGVGVQAVLEDLLNVLGRDGEQLEQLRAVDLLAAGRDLFLSILQREPLDADIWWNGVEGEPEMLDSFAQRCRLMDFRDRRSNVVFGRRLERVSRAGLKDLFSELVTHLLAHRPDNHELWVEFGRHHEQAGDLTQAWLCYDQAQIFNPNDSNKSRLAARIESGAQSAGFSGPDAEQISAFQRQLRALASRLESKVEQIPPAAEEESVATERGLRPQLESLLARGADQEAFFLARSLLVEGEEWASEYFEQARSRIQDG